MYASKQHQKEFVHKHVIRYQPLKAKEKQLLDTEESMIL